MKNKITDFIERAEPQLTVQVEIPDRLKFLLIEQLDKDNISQRQFIIASIRAYLAEKGIKHEHIRG
jgi:hypothetical protein